MYCTNVTKSAMQTWKKYFKVGASLPQEFPIAYCLKWNVAWTKPYWHKKQLMALVSPCEIHTTDMNTIEGFYVGPVMCNNWCYHTIIVLTSAMHISNTVRFLHNCFTIPTITLSNRIVEATKKLQHAIKQQPLEHNYMVIAIKKLWEVLLGKPLPVPVMNQYAPKNAP